MRYPALFALIALALVTPSRVHATDSPRTREKLAKKACAAGDFRKGVEILADLYVDTNDVTFVYNQGRCYEQNHQWTGAIDRFREYLRKSPDAKPSVKAETEKHIADCEALREQEEPKPVPAPLAAPPEPVAAPLPPPLPPAVENAVVAQPTPPKEGRGFGLRVTGIVLGSAGVATAVVGLVLNLKANKLADDYDKTQDPATRSSYSSYKTGAIVCYGAGAGMLATGVVLYLVGRSAAGEGTGQVSYLPVLTPGEFSLSVRRAF
jgi:hypothetical protein